MHEATCGSYFIVKCLLQSNEARVILFTYLLHRSCLISVDANLYKQLEAKTASTNLMWLYFYLHISLRIFCTLFICFVLDGLLQLICFRMFRSKYSITFENTYSTYKVVDFTIVIRNGLWLWLWLRFLWLWFHCVHVSYNKFRFYAIFTVINSVTRILLIETLYEFRNIKCWFILYLQVYVLG